MVHALAWFLIGYSDGFVYWLMRQTETSGYMVYITPIVVAYILYLSARCGISTTPSLILKQFIFALFVALIFFFQVFIIGEIYIAGYIQIMVMIGLILLITDLFKINETILRPYFARGMLIVHYIICVYAIVAWFVLRTAGQDISLYIVDMDTLSSFAVNRTSGLHREPSWAGYALATSYLAVLITRSHRMLLPQIAYLMAIAATGAGAGLILASLFIAYQTLTTNRGGLIIRLGLVAGLGLLGLIVFSGRIGAVLNQNDPSSQMRLESTTVAAEVIAETFPIGTGFGNYQDYAVFDPTVWGSFIDIAEATYYKSDILVLNFVAELGFFGVILIILLIKNFFVKINILIPLTVIVMMLTSGTIILPTYFVLAAITGLERGRAARLAWGGKETSP